MYEEVFLNLKQTASLIECCIMDLNQWLFKGGYSPRKKGIDK